MTQSMMRHFWKVACPPIEARVYNQYFAALMLTRNKRTEVETRRKGYTKKIIVCERIQRFLSPGTNYQPYHVCHPLP